MPTDNLPRTVAAVVSYSLIVWKQFKDFAFRGSVIELAIGVVMGAAFNAVVQSVVGDVLTPLVGIVSGNPDLAELDVEVLGATLGIGNLVNTFIYFLIVAFTLFVVVRLVARIREAVPGGAVPITTRPCPYCLEPVVPNARRCRHCTSDLTTKQAA